MKREDEEREEKDDEKVWKMKLKNCWGTCYGVYRLDNKS